MALFPDSAFSRDLREFNNCHSPKDGKFAPKGADGCDPGQETDPGRQRSTYASAYEGPDAEARVTGLLEPDNSLDFWRKTGAGDGSADERKDDVARNLGDALDGYVEDGSLPEDSLSKFTDEFSLYEPDNSGDGETVGKTMEQLEEEYQQDYDEYVSEIQDNAMNEAENEYMDNKKKSIQNIDDAITSLSDDIDAARLHLGHTEHANMDVLPGLEGVTEETLHHEGDYTPSMDEVVQVLKDHYLGRLDDDVIKNESGPWDDLSTEEKDQLAQVIGHWVPSAGMLHTLQKDNPTNKNAHGYDSWVARNIEDFSDSVLSDKESQYDPADEMGKNYDRWRENAYESVSAYDNGADSISTWIKDNHADELSSDEGGNAISPEAAHQGDYTDAQKIASTLVHRWADTSGDHDSLAVAVQLAANKEFGLGATYTGKFTGDEPHALSSEKGTLTKAKGILKTHGDLLQAFVRATYASTQSALAKAGYKPDDLITLYRGVALKSADGLDAFPRSGAIIDVVTQPLSSFSTSPGTAVSFSGHGYSGNTASVMITRVPVKSIFSTPATGNGCQNESEVVVLGGRYPSYVKVQDGHIFGDLSPITRGSAVERWLKDTGRHKVAIDPGDG